MEKINNNFNMNNLNVKFIPVYYRKSDQAINNENISLKDISEDKIKDVFSPHRLLDSELEKIKSLNLINFGNKNSEKDSDSSTSVVTKTTVSPTKSSTVVSKVTTPKVDTKTKKIEDLIKLAKDQVGKKYIWGERNPDKGFDCSGLADYLYTSLGYNIGPSTTEQFNAGKEVASVSDLKVGDLIGTSSSGPSKRHIKIVSSIDDDGTIHTIEAKGKKYGVVESTLDNTNNIITMRRIILKKGGLIKRFNLGGGFTPTFNPVIYKGSTYKSTFIPKENESTSAEESSEFDNKIERINAAIADLLKPKEYTSKKETEKAESEKVEESKESEKVSYPKIEVQEPVIKETTITDDSSLIDLSTYSPSSFIKTKIKDWEGFRENVYNDLTGHPTVGYGFNLDAYPELSKYSKGMSKEEADKVFENIISKMLPVFKRITPNRKYTQNQLDALFSLYYNIGPGTYQNSKNLMQSLQDGDFQNAAISMNHGENKYEGLKRRRDWERHLFLNV